MNNNDFIKKQARVMAEYEMENMTPVEIKEIEEKQKKFFIFVGCGVLLFTVLIIVAMGFAWFSPSGEFLSGLLLLFCGIFLDMVCTSVLVKFKREKKESWCLSI